MDQVAAALSLAIAFAREPPQEAEPPGADTCRGCAGRLVRLFDGQFSCEGCGALVEGDPPAAGPEPIQSRMRVQGAHAGLYQPDMYRCAPEASLSELERALYEELQNYNSSYASRTGTSFPLNVLLETARLYSAEVQPRRVLRSDNKRMTLAAILKEQARREQISLPDKNISDFFDLRKGFSRGDQILRELRSECRARIDSLDRDPCPALVNTFFHTVGLGDAEYDDLRRAAVEVVEASRRANVGIHSLTPAKAAGATFAVLCRARRRLRAPPPPLAQICTDSVGKHIIRPVTAAPFVACLRAHHGVFEEVYRKYGLEAGPDDDQFLPAAPPRAAAAAAAPRKVKK
jgi:hypothetical protein